MRYVETINVYAPGILTLMHEGALRLQPGQWIACGTGSPKSRFSHVTAAKVIVAFHYPDAAGKFIRYRQDGKAAAALCAKNRALRLNGAFRWAQKEA